MLDANSFWPSFLAPHDPHAPATHTRTTWELTKFSATLLRVQPVHLLMPTMQSKHVCPFPCYKELSAQRRISTLKLIRYLDTSLPNQ